jgi:hypothetical protein
MSRTRSALFVDFDNIYLGLLDVEDRAAHVFATNPGQWLEWIEKRLGVDGAVDHPHGPLRSVLVRSTYLNPSRFGRFRADFTRAGFSVIDCPSLTLQGKSSADIRMVLDIVDTLEHATHFDEFIIFSGDADFTPLLQRLRAHDRRTAILAIGPAARAYKAAADSLIDEDLFMEQALRIRIGANGHPSDRSNVPQDFETSRPPGAAIVPERSTLGTAVLDLMAARVLREVDLCGRVLAGSLPRLFREFKEFTRTSEWLGFKSLRRLTEQLVLRETRLEIEGQENQDWFVRLRAEASATAVDSSYVAGTQVSVAGTRVLSHSEDLLVVRSLAERHAAGELAPAQATAAAGEIERAKPLQDTIAQIVQRVVSGSGKPVPLATAAQLVIDELGTSAIDSRWAGYGSFKSLVATMESTGIRISDGAPGYVYDPSRHSLPPNRSDDTFPPELGELASFARRVFNVTGAPYLAPDAYAVLFESIGQALRTADFQMGTTSVLVRDECEARGLQVSRQNVQFVIKGIGFGGYKLTDEVEEHVPRELATAFRDNVRKLCKNAQMTLSEEELALLDSWLLGGLVASS